MPDRDVYREGWTRWLPRYPRQIGHSGRMMLLLGVAWVAVGVMSIGGRDLPDVLHGVMLPTHTGGAVWIITGTLAILTVWRPPGYRSALGWTALYVMPAIRVVGNLALFMPYLREGGDPGDPYALAYAIIYSVIVGVVYICSDWPDPVPYEVSMARAKERSREIRGRR